MLVLARVRCPSTRNISSVVEVRVWGLPSSTRVMILFSGMVTVSPMV